MKLLLSPKAEDDLLDIWDFSSNWFSKTQANTYIEKINTCFVAIQDYPQIGKRLDFIKAHYWLYVCQKHHIVYQLQTEQIFIVRVLHQSNQISKIVL